MTETEKKRPSPTSLRFAKHVQAALDQLRGDTPISAYLTQLILWAFENGKFPRGSRGLPIEQRAALAQILALLGQSNIRETADELRVALKSGSLLLDEQNDATFARIENLLSEILALLMSAFDIRSAE